MFLLVKQVSLPNLKQAASSEAQKKVNIPVAEQAEAKPVEKQAEKPVEKKPKKEKVEKKGKDKNTGAGGTKQITHFLLVIHLNILFNTFRHGFNHFYFRQHLN